LEVFRSGSVSQAWPKDRLGSPRFLASRRAWFHQTTQTKVCPCS
jgi:hypothetical protein